MSIGPGGAVIIGRLCHELGTKLHKLFSEAGAPILHVIRGYERPGEILARADAEGGVPIILVWNEQASIVALFEALVQSDPLPGRTYVLIAPSRVVGSLINEELDAVPNRAIDDRSVLVISHEDLDDPLTLVTVKLAFERAPASYIGRPSHDRGVKPAPITDPPIGERNINNIDRRVMQRGMFRVTALRIPRFGDTTPTDSAATPEQNQPTTDATNGRGWKTFNPAKWRERMKAKQRR